MTNRNLTSGSQPTIDESVLKEFFTKAEGLRNLDEAKDLRRKIGERRLEGFLFPLTRVLDAIIEENSDLVEILSIEIRIVAEEIIAMLRRNFDWNWRAQGITGEMREKFGYEAVYTLETNK